MFTNCARAYIVGGTLLGITLPHPTFATSGHTKSAEIRKVEHAARTSVKRNCVPVPMGQGFPLPVYQSSENGLVCAAPATTLPPLLDRQLQGADRQGIMAHPLPATTAVFPPHPQSPSSSRRRHLGSFAMTAYTQYHTPPQRTASGTIPTIGRTVAVDPKVIPLGTKLHIEGVGVRIAEDTGRKIRGKKLDLFLSSRADCTRFGIRARQVYILD